MLKRSAHILHAEHLSAADDGGGEALALLDVCAGTGARGVAENHGNVVGTGGHEVVARTEFAEDDALEPVALPTVLLAADAICGTEGPCIGGVDVRQSGTPDVGAFAVFVEFHFILRRLTERSVC